MIVDFRKQQREHLPIHIEGPAMEKVESFKFLCVHITDKLKWSTHTDNVVKKAQQHLFNLRKAEEICLVTQNPAKLLQIHNREHPVGLYHCLVRQLHLPQLQGTPEGGAVCTPHHRGQTTCPPGHLQRPMSQEGRKDHQGQQTTRASACSHRYHPEGKVSTGASKLGPRD